MALLEKAPKDVHATASERRESPAEARVRRERQAVARLEQVNPPGSLRRRLLDLLASAPSTPSELAREASASKEAVSRKLRELRDEGMVESRRDPDDARRMSYSLTAQGESELSRYRAFGAAEPPLPSPSHEQDREFLWGALDAAIQMRRRANRIRDAVDRFEAIRAEAEKIGAHDIALDALAEWATTLRQDRKTTELRRILDELDDIALGNVDIGPELVLPAAAHLEYARGRMGDLGNEEIRDRAQHLNAAIALYAQLAHNADGAKEKGWREHWAWSVISLAGNLRKQSEFEASLKYAAVAMKQFAALEDAYGRSHCLFMFGFCLRLLGDFDKAWVCLNDAYEMAAAQSFRCIRADALMQMGEVRRCQGQIEEARMLLNDALEEADDLGLPVTHAFAQSALGAVAYQAERFEEAEVLLGFAQKLFHSCQHVEGEALNARRRATVVRRLSGEGSGPGALVASNLLRRARTRYTRLSRPAGMVACEIEQGRLRMLRDGRRVDEVVEKLTGWLADTHRTKIVELDPWVPRVLDEFAREVGNEKLAKGADEMLDSARVSLADKAAEGMKSVSEAIGQVTGDDDGDGDGRAAEMGGETRRDASELTLPLAV